MKYRYMQVTSSSKWPAALSSTTSPIHLRFADPVLRALGDAALVPDGCLTYAMLERWRNHRSNGKKVVEQVQGKATKISLNLIRSPFEMFFCLVFFQKIRLPSSVWNLS